MEVDDRNYLRFFWRKDDGQIQTLRYNRQVFGANLSPTCTSFALKQCGKEFNDKFPEASRAFLSSFYKDDLLVSVESVKRAKVLSSELQTLLMKGSFNLTKWVLNDSDVFKDQKPYEMNPTVHGLEWLLGRDELKVCRGVSFESQQQRTRKEVLSKVSSLLDILGFMVPISIRGKLVMKQIWQTQGQQWDKPIEES